MNTMARACACGPFSRSGSNHVRPAGHIEEAPVDIAKKMFDELNKLECIKHGREHYHDGLLLEERCFVNYVLSESSSIALELLCCPGK